MGGTWLALVYGFAGMRDTGGRITFNPCLPDAWTRLSFTLTVRGQTIRVALSHASATYTLLAGDGLTLWHVEEGVRLSGAEPSVTKAIRRPAGDDHAAEP